MVKQAQVRTPWGTATIIGIYSRCEYLIRMDDTGKIRAIPCWKVEEI